MIIKKFYFIIFYILLNYYQILVADVFHYKNVLVGDRAMGMGGAFCGISDDASALIYNPAGIAYSLSNDVSGSANVFSQKEITYKKVIGTKNFTEKSEAILSPFVGGISKLDNIYPGLLWSFGIATLDSDLKDQDDLISEPSIYIQRFHRTANIRANTHLLGFALAKRISTNISIGISLSYIKTHELEQIYQDVITSTTDNKYLKYITQNIRTLLLVNVIQTGLGIQIGLDNGLTIGLSSKIPFIISESLEYNLDKRAKVYDIAQSKIVDKNDTTLNDNEKAQIQDLSTILKYKKPLKTMPYEITGGVAWFVSTTVLIAADVTYHTESKNGENIYDRNNVINYSLGGEFFITSNWALRTGFFTNNDARSKPSNNKANQRDSIDYQGGSLFIVYNQPNSQISLGTVAQIGQGKAQKIAGSVEIQDVTSITQTYGFSVAHSF